MMIHILLSVKNDETLIIGWIIEIVCCVSSSKRTSQRERNNDNPDKIEVGVFPRHNDDMKLEVAWTILPFI